jgi:hypothetical protein
LNLGLITLNRHPKEYSDPLGLADQIELLNGAASCENLLSRILEEQRIKIEALTGNPALN